MFRFIYSVMFYLALPIILIRLLIRSLAAPDYRRRIGERLALNSLPENFDSSKQTIWIHAVSVGETVAAGPLVSSLLQSYPEIQVMITTMTPTGSDRARSLFGERVFHSYIPYDLPGATNRFLNKLKPTLLILMETELWPNLIFGCHHRKIKMVLANARLSEKSARGYKRFSAFTKALLAKLDSVAVQAKPDSDRFVGLGLDPGKANVTGSLKFNVEVNSVRKENQAYFDFISSSKRQVFIAASTREGEEEKVLTAFEKCLKAFPSLLMIIVPRHPERFSKVVDYCETRGFQTEKRSAGRQLNAVTQILVGDSMGEMLDYYRVANIAFVGGSLVDTGCHNVLEPAAMGIPIVTGPSQFNSATICRQLEEVTALKTVQNEAQLADFLIELLADSKKQQEMGLRGRELVAANQHALPALLGIIKPFIQTA